MFFNLKEKVGAWFERWVGLNDDFLSDGFCAGFRADPPEPEPEPKTDPIFQAVLHKLCEHDHQLFRDRADPENQLFRLNTLQYAQQDAIRLLFSLERILQDEHRYEDDGK